LIDKKKNCQCRNSGIQQFRLLYICLLEQQYATVSAPVHSRQLPISSLFLRKKEETDNINYQAIQQPVYHPSRIMCTYPVKPTVIKRAKTIYITTKKICCLYIKKQVKNILIIYNSGRRPDSKAADSRWKARLVQASKQASL
jgi:hypothetical protein